MFTGPLSFNDTRDLQQWTRLRVRYQVKWYVLRFLINMLMCTATQI